MVSGSDKLDNLELYATGVYATITFIVTVGYGDILAINYVEKLFATVLI